MPEHGKNPPPKGKPAVQPTKPPAPARPAPPAHGATTTVHPAAPQLQPRAGSSSAPPPAAPIHASSLPTVHPEDDARRVSAQGAKRNSDPIVATSPENDTAVTIEPEPPTSLSNPNYGEGQKPKKESLEFYSPVLSTEEVWKPEERSGSRDEKDYVFLTPPHEGEPAVQVWHRKDLEGFHTPPDENGGGWVGLGRPLSDPALPSHRPVSRKPSLLYSSEEEGMGLSISKTHSNEKVPLLKPRETAQDILNRMLVMDRDANRFEDSNVMTMSFF